MQNPRPITCHNDTFGRNLTFEDTKWQNSNVCSYMSKESFITSTLNFSFLHFKFPKTHSLDLCTIITEENNFSQIGGTYKNLPCFGGGAKLDIKGIFARGS